MRNAAVREVYAHWNEARRLRSSPERADIDPTAIRNALADTFILENEAGAPFRLRIAGARFSALFQRETRGEDFTALFDTDGPSVAAALWTVMDGVCPILAGLEAGPEGYPRETMEMILLPLRHFGRTHARLLGACAAFRHPSWLGLAPSAPLRLTSLRILSVDGAPNRGREIYVASERAAPRGVRRGMFEVHEGGRDS